MKLADFATQFEELGLNLSAYQGAAYYGASEEWSLALQPYQGERIQHAKFAISVSRARQSPEMLDRFLSAAAVEKTPQMRQALESGREFRGMVSEKEVSFSAVGPDLVLNVIE